jgi:hypothetical protein
MTFNKLIRPPVGADDAMFQTTPAHCRGRFIVPTAALSARAGYFHFRILSSMTIIESLPLTLLCDSSVGVIDFSNFAIDDTNSAIRA